MDFKYLPYKFEPCLNSYKNELLFTGVTYYERFFIFEHFKKSLNQVLGFTVDKIELAFQSETLVCVWLFTTEKRLEELIGVFQSYYNESPQKVNLEYLALPTSNIQFYWADENYVIGLGYNPHIDQSFIFVSKKENNQYLIEG